MSKHSVFHILAEDSLFVNKELNRSHHKHSLETGTPDGLNESQGDIGQ
jgi:hypothetical protein